MRLRISVGAVLAVWTVFQSTISDAVQPREWEVIEGFNNGFRARALSVGFDQTIWVAGDVGGGSSIYHLESGAWAEMDPVAEVGIIAGVAVVSEDRGWAVGEYGLLEYDGVFWRRVLDQQRKEEEGNSQVTKNRGRNATCDRDVVSGRECLRGADANRQLVDGRADDALGLGVDLY